VRALLPVLLLLPAAGCVSLRYERARIGSARPVVDARRLETGKATLKEALEKLGPPDLILRAGHIDRAYWVAWDTTNLKLDVSLSLRQFSWDAFILGLGSEDLRLARLEFDRQGILRYAQVTDFESSREGEYVAIHNRIASTFLEDTTRMLGVIEEDDDEEDVELDKPK
jgi:hypothetical protein